MLKSSLETRNTSPPPLAAARAAALDPLRERHRAMLAAGGSVVGLRQAARRAERAHPRRRDLILFRYVGLPFHVDRCNFGLRIYARAEDDVVFLAVYD